MSEFYYLNTDTDTVKKAFFTGKWYVHTQSQGGCWIWVEIYKYSWFPWIFKTFIREDDFRWVESCRWKK